MSDLGNMSELIPIYLKGELSGDELRVFEEELGRNEDLRDELAELSRIYTGLRILDRIESGHIRSGDLALFAEDPDRIDRHLRNDIEAHLKLCPECSEELEACKESIREAENLDMDCGNSKSFASRMLEWLFRPRYLIRPVSVYAAALLIVVFGYWGLQHLQHPVPGTAVFELDPSAVRGEAGRNLVIVEEGSSLVRLEFRIVVRGDFYDLEVCRPDGAVVFSKPSNVTREVSGNQFAFEVPISYLPEGRYHLNVIERDSAGTELDRRAIEFEIRIE